MGSIPIQIESRYHGLLAVEVARRGGVLCDSSMAALLRNPGHSIFEIKRRPSSADASLASAGRQIDLQKYAHIHNWANKLVEAYWPELPVVTASERSGKYVFCQISKGKFASPNSPCVSDC